MTEKNVPTSPLPPESVPAPPTQPAPPTEPAPSAPPVPETKAKDREGRGFGTPVVGGIAAATLLIGGLAGGIIGYAVHSDGPDGGRPDGPGRFQQGGGPGGHGGFHGQAPDGWAPDGQTPDGQTPDGQTPDGQTPDSQSDGSAS